MPLPSKTGIQGLYKDADGRYRIDLRYRDRSGRKDRYKEVMPLGTPAAAARLRAQSVLADALAGTLTKRGAETPETFGAAFGKYLEWCKVNGGAADPKYKERHRDHWIETLGARFALDQLSELSIEKHKKRRKDAGKEPGTINRELVTIKHFLNRCVDWGWLAKRPKVTLLQEPPPRVRWLTAKERAALGTQLAKPQRAAFRRVVNAALLSGQRLGKIITLKRTDVDLAGGTITIADMAKGGKRRTTHVPVSPALGAILKEALAQSKDGEHVFSTGRGEKRPYTRSGVSTFFARVATEAGLKDFHFHDLRHSFATEVRRAGAGLDVVQALLGHASPAMTQRYAHLGRAELAAAVKRIAPALPPAARAERKKSQKKAAKTAGGRAS
jgi:integrase